MNLIDNTKRYFNQPGNKAKVATSVVVVAVALIGGIAIGSRRRGL